MEAVRNASQEFRDAGVALGGTAMEVAAAFNAAIEAQVAFVAKAGFTAKPEGAGLQQLLDPISTQMSAIDELAGKRSPFDQHCKMVNNAAASFSWVVDAKPVDTLAEALDSTTYVANKLRATHKGDANHTSFINTLIAALKALDAYVKDNHAKGLQWASSSSAAAPTPAPTAASSSGSSTQAVQTAAGEFRDAGVALGGTAMEVAAAFNAAIEAQVAFVAKASTTTKPEGAALQELLAPISTQMSAIDELAGKRSPFDQHCKMVNNAAASFSWVVDAKPVDTLAEALDSTTYVANKLRATHKGDANHTSFINTLIAALKALDAYVKNNHAKGLQWGTAKAVPPPPAPAGKKSLPPPPPPPPPKAAEAAPEAAATGVTALFAEIRAKGDNITQGLRHVDDSQKVYKNRDKNAEATALTLVPKDAKAASKGSWRPPAGKAATALNGDKFYSVQYHSAPDSEDFTRVTISPKKQHAINVYRCVNTLIVVEGKCNSIQIVECLNTHVIVNGTLGPVEVSNSQRIEVLLSVFTPSVIFSAVKGAVVHLGEPSLLETDFVTSCASNVNLVVAWTEDREEIPLHEQFESVIAGNVAVTKPVEHSSSD